MGVALAVGLLFLAASVYKLSGPKPDTAVALQHFAIASVLIGVFFFLRAGRGRDAAFLRWLSENSVAIEGGGARYGNVLITPATTLTRYEVALSFLLVSYKLRSRLYIVGHDATPLVATALTVISLLLGWWGVPWGPVYTVQAVWSNVRGGITLTIAELSVLSQAGAAGRPSRSMRWPLSFRWTCILVMLGVGFSYALIAGIPLEDFNPGTWWEELLFGKRVQDLIEAAYLTDRDLTGGALDPRTVPKIDEFQTTHAGVVTFFLALRKLGAGEKRIDIRTRWYSEDGVERKVIKTVHRQRALKGGTGTWASHEVAGSLIAQHPGRWTVKLSLDGRAAGEFYFRVVSPGRGGVAQPSVPRLGD